MKVNKRQLADIFGVDVDTITNWQKEANFPPYDKRIGRYGSIYDSAAVIRWRMGEGDDAAERLKRLQGDKVELELERIRGDSLSRPSMELHFAATGAAVRSRLLALESKVRPFVDDEAREVIAAAVREALTEMSSDAFNDRVRVEFAGRLAEGDDAAAGTDAEPVGRPVQETERRGKRRARAVAH